MKSGALPDVRATFRLARCINRPSIGSRSCVGKSLSAGGLRTRARVKPLDRPAVPFPRNRPKLTFVEEVACCSSLRSRMPRVARYLMSSALVLSQVAAALPPINGNRRFRH